jgi:two-component system, sensor histidine kinase
MSSPPADPARTAKARAEAQIVARAGHDIRQPLHALALFHAALHRRVGDEQTQSIVFRAEQAGAALSRVMLGMLALAQVNAGENEPAFRVVAVEAVFEALKQELAPDLGATTLTLEGGGAASTDPETLKGILRPLLLYAVAAGHDAGMAARREADQCVIELTWSGPLPEDVAALLTGDFVRAAATPRTARDGMDLELLVAARQAEALRVAIEAAQTGDRTTIRITLPAAP